MVETMTRDQWLAELLSAPSNPNNVPELLPRRRANPWLASWRAGQAAYCREDTPPGLDKTIDRLSPYTFCVWPGKTYKAFLFGSIVQIDAGPISPYDGVRDIAFCFADGQVFNTRISNYDLLPDRIGFIHLVELACWRRTGWPWHFGNQVEYDSRHFDLKPIWIRPASGPMTYLRQLFTEAPDIDYTVPALRAAIGPAPVPKPAPSAPPAVLRQRKRSR